MIVEVEPLIAFKQCFLCLKFVYIASLTSAFVNSQEVTKGSASSEPSRDGSGR